MDGIRGYQQEYLRFIKISTKSTKITIEFSVYVTLIAMGESRMA